MLSIGRDTDWQTIRCQLKLELKKEGARSCAIVGASASRRRTGFLKVQNWGVLKRHPGSPQFPLSGSNLLTNLSRTHADGTWRRCSLRYTRTTRPRFTLGIG
jgi:hypothetical protein